MNIAEQVLSILGFIIRAIGFVVLGFGVTRFVLDAYSKAVWQLQAVIIAGFFILLIGLTNYSSAGSMGMFAIGAGAVLLMQFMGKKEEKSESSK
jgi:hypothetical protein